MMSSSWKWLVAGAMVVGYLSLPGLAEAQESAQESATVSATGRQLLQRSPSQMAIRIELSGRGPSLKEALAQLEERKEAAGIILKSLGADMETVTYGDPTTSSASGVSQGKLQAMIRQRISRSGEPAPEGLKLPESTTVAVPLSVRWNLEGDDSIELLQQTSKLRKAIEEADIAGMNDDSASLPEQELLEEAEGFGYRSYSGEEPAKPGTPVFSFVATITPEERREALQAAFQAARDNAEELAAASGRKLADLIMLESNAIGGSPYGEEMYGYPGAYRRQVSVPQIPDRLTSQSDEFGKLPFMFMIQARFKLAPADD